MSDFQGEDDYILINLEMLPSGVPQPALVSKQVARYFGLTPGCTVRQPEAIDIDVEIVVMHHLFGTKVKGELKNQEETK